MKIKNFIVIGVSVFVIFVSLGFVGIINSNSSLKSTDVQVYSGKVESIDKNIVGVDVTYEISVTGYLCDLFIGQEGANYDLSVIDEGDIITFSIENKYINTFESNAEIINDMFVPIVSLKSEHEEIFSLEEYNDNLQRSFKIPLLFCIIVIVVSFLALIFSVISKIVSKIGIVNNKS